MRYDTRYRYSSSLNWSFPPGVKWLIVANVAFFLLDFIVGMFSGGLFSRPFWLVPREVMHGAIWELVTYMFLHDPSSIFHILFNMLGLWMFGRAIEQTWGTARFIRYYFVCGIGAGICVVVVNMIAGNPNQSVIGASGAIFGLLLAFGMLFPDQTILLNFVLPIKAKYLVVIYGVFAFFGMRTQSNISNLAHLGGILFGYIYMRTSFGQRFGFRFDLERRWKDYKLQRAKKKFQVYMKKQDGRGGGPWVN